MGLFLYPTIILGRSLSRHYRNFARSIYTYSPSYYHSHSMSYTPTDFYGHTNAYPTASNYINANTSIHCS